MQGLNDRQSEACSYTEGPLLILAGAGSGKTRVITHRIAHLIKDKGVDPYNILAITFTNKAANEMKERTQRIVGEGADRVWVSTFHSMCVRILRRFYDRIGGNNNFTIYDSDEQKTVMKETVKTLGLDPKMYNEKSLLNMVSRAKENYISPEKMEHEAVNYHDSQNALIYKEYQSRLVRNNALDFDDLIFKTIRLFQTCPDVLEIYQDRFRYIMVDEYQDTNHTQFVLVSMLAGMYKNLCVVGDDDQSIYKFRGANIYNILNFEEQFPDAKVVRLEQNYRSTGNILNAANAVIRNNSGRKEKTLWTDKGPGELLKYTRYENEYAEAEGIVRMIGKISSSDRLSDIAVLYRTNNQSRVIEEKLIYASIPYNIVGGQNFYARKEIRDIVSYLKIIDNPDDSVALRRIINVPKRSIGAASVEKLAAYADSRGISLFDACNEAKDVPGLGKTAEKIIAFTELISEVSAKAEEGSLTDAFDLLMDMTEYTVLLEAEGTDEARTRIDNIEELRNKIAQYENDSENPSLTELLEDIALVADTETDDEDGDRVTLMTLHSAKGLEFKNVFMAGMEERLFPSGLALDSDDPDETEEERRLCYVGITRAMERLYLSGAETRMVRGSRTFTDESRFIKEIPDELLEMTDRSSGQGAERRPKYSYGEESQEYTGSSFDNIHKKAYSAVHKAYSTSVSKGVPGNVSVDYGVGDRVKHIKFGKGTVTELIKGSSDTEVTVNFDRVGEKKLFASLAKLKKVDS